MIDATVVMPVYNAESTLERALAGVLCQSDIQLEILCIDDNSTDDSRRLLEMHAELDQRVKVVTSRGKGPGAARNHGIELAKGCYVSFIDADDYVELPLQQLIARLDAEDAQILQFGYMLESPEGERISIRSLNDAVLAGGPSCFEFFYRQQYGPSACFALYNTEFIRASGLRFDPSSHYEDAHFFRSSVMAARTVLTSSVLGYHYVRYPSSRSNQWGLSQLKQLCQLQLANIDALGDTDVRQKLIDDIQGFAQLLVSTISPDCAQIISTFLDQYTGQYGKLVVYGTGSVGRSLMQQLPKRPEQSRFFCDSKPEKAGSRVDDVQVISLDQLKALNDCHIIIGSSFVNEIYQSLTQAGLQERVLAPGARAFNQWLAEGENVHA